MCLHRSSGLMWIAIWSMSLWADDMERQRWAERIRTADQAYDRGDYRSSLDALSPAIHIAETFGPHDLGLALTLSRLGSVYLGLGRFRQAEDAYLRSLAAWQQAAPVDPERSVILASLVTVYGKTGEFTKAEKFGRMAIAIQEQAYGRESVNLGGPLQNLAAILQSEHRYAEAQDLYQRALHILEKSDRPNFTASAHSNLGLLFSEMGRPADGIAEVQRAVAIWEASFGREHPWVVPGLINLATLYCHWSRWAEAQEPIRRARDIIVKSFGPDHPMLDPILRTYSDVLQHAGRKREAKQMARTAQTILQRSRSENAIGYTMDVSSYR
jgi:tetratricopeptide (TPR) repeat protein